MELSNDMKTRIVPSLRYQDCRQAIDWLCAAFGFEEQLIVPSEDGGITHAQLVCGMAMIMLGDGHRDDDDPFGQLNKSPLQLDGYNTAGVYMIVEDVDAHYEKARAAGAAIVLDIVDQGYGGRGYTCKDL
ncbi:MAG TPA: glyoxalase, partial [Pseudomonadales bacterium]|nr:glyoxalase [Pseudomonadales bacterium]